MTLLLILILAAVLVVIGIFLLKKTARNKISGTGNVNPPATGPTPPSENPGSIPDKAGTRGDGDSVLSSGGQG